MNDKKALRVAGVTEQPQPSVTVLYQDFAPFYLDQYRALIRSAMYAGGTLEQAEDAISVTMAEMLHRWPKIHDPVKYARKAVINNLIKEKTRGLDRIRQKLARHAGIREGCDDAGLSAWENRQWVLQLLATLPPAQREVMACIVDEFHPAEIGELLGKSPEAVRQNLSAARHRLRQTLSEQKEKAEMRSGQLASQLPEEEAKPHEHA